MCSFYSEYFIMGKGSEEVYWHEIEPFCTPLRIALFFFCLFKKNIGFVYWFCQLSCYDVSYPSAAYELFSLCFYYSCQSNVKNLFDLSLCQNIYLHIIIFHKIKLQLEL